MRWIAALFVGVIFWVSSVCAAQGSAQQSTTDTIRLRNGQEITGRVTAEDDKTVSLLMIRGGEIVLPRHRISEIVRGTRESQGKGVQVHPELLRFEPRDDFFLVYYRGVCVGWRQTTLEPSSRNNLPGYLFTQRVVHIRPKGGVDMDVRVTEFVDQALRPRSVSVSEVSRESSSLTEGSIEDGYLRLVRNGTAGTRHEDVLFSDSTELMMPLIRRLADSSVFPQKGAEYKVFDPVRRRYHRVRATRSLRKEVVAGRQQPVTVWRLTSGREEREIWIGRNGGVVREELVGSHMVALRTPSESVLAFAKGGGLPEGSSNLNLSHVDESAGFRLERPNLTWSFECPDRDGNHVLTLLNPTLQASVDVLVLEDVGGETEPETIFMDVMERMKRGSTDHRIEKQELDEVGDFRGMRFEVTSERRGVILRTLGAVTTLAGKAYIVLAGIPVNRLKEGRRQVEAILGSFKVLDAEGVGQIVR